jgi:16S rRNA (cytosine1402-N4)-methyltransferase
LSDKGVLLVFDQDGDALNNKIDDPRLIFCEANFEYLANFCSYYKLSEIDGLLADLGVSSHHLNDKDRGFSFRFEESDLDMRMNSSSKISAIDILNSYDQPSLAKVFRSYGELDKASPLANAIISYRSIQPIKTNADLMAAVSKFTNERSKNKMLAKIYQALRIEVNREISTLKSLLTQATDLLKSQGRLVVMSYHSLEDRIVKNLIQTGNVEGERKSDPFGRVSKPYRAINKKPIEASKEEVEKNSRARSAKLRVAEKI